MSIKESLVRQSTQDKVEIGEVCRRAYEGKFGEVLRAVINGLITEEKTNNQYNRANTAPISAERILGRLEGYENIIRKIEQAIEEARLLQEPIQEGGESEES